MKQFLRKSLMHYDDSVLYTVENMIYDDDVSYSNIRSLLRNLITM